MSHTQPQLVTHDTVPRLPLLAAGALVVVSLLAVSVVQFTGVGATRVADAPAVSVRQFTFEDRRDGGIDVRRADTGRVVHSVAPETNGFLRGTMRGLARERKRMGIGPELPFDLVGRADGSLTLVDPGTGRRVDLGSFGPDNSAAFATLMQAQ